MGEDAWGKAKDAFEEVLGNPETILNMQGITGVNVSCGLLLKAFFDEFFLKHKRRPDVRSPKSSKVRTIFNYLKSSQYTDVARKRFKDIDCWEIRSWEASMTKDTQFSRMLLEEIIPKYMSQHSSNIASSVAEALLNSSEHAYKGKKSHAEFRKLYLGAGQYPGSDRFYFCIYDKGIGIVQSLKDNPYGWKMITDAGTSDSKMIEKATKGRSGVVGARKKVGEKA